MVHYALGDPPRSRADPRQPPLLRQPARRVHAMCRSATPCRCSSTRREDEREALDAARGRHLRRSRRSSGSMPAGVRQLCPLLKGDAVAGLADRDGIRLDPHALLQGNLRQLRRSGGGAQTGARIRAIERRAGGLDGRQREKARAFERRSSSTRPAPGRDQIAALAGVRPIGLQPMRRTIITFDAPPGTDWTGCPSPRRSATSFISRPKAGGCSLRRWTRCRASRATPSRTNMKSRSPPIGWRSGQRSRSSRIHSRWAGLRTFTPDRHPAAGFAADADGFFWLAGQGGFGLQTSPAMAAIAASLIAGMPWPVADVRGRAKSRPLPPAAGIGRPSARRPARTSGSVATSTEVLSDPPAG